MLPFQVFPSYFLFAIQNLSFLLPLLHQIPDSRWPKSQGLNARIVVATVVESLPARPRPHTRHTRKRKYHPTLAANLWSSLAHNWTLPNGLDLLSYHWFTSDRIPNSRWPKSHGLNAIIFVATIVESPPARPLPHTRLTTRRGKYHHKLDANL